MRLLFKGLGDIGGGSESPNIRDSPIDSLNRKHYITAPGGHEGSEAHPVSGIQDRDRKVSRVQRGMYHFQNQVVFICRQLMT